MSSYALTLRSPTACSDDYDRQNPIVRQAYNGLLAYDSLYRASCLKAAPSPANNNSNDYCFADAVTNTSSPTDNYIYYLPLGITLPAGSMPTCSQCLHDTMGLFAQAAGNQSQPLSLTYVNSAQMVNLKCGPAYVNASVPNASGGSSGKSGAAALSPPSLSVLAAGALLAGGWQVLAAL